MLPLTQTQEHHLLDLLKSHQERGFKMLYELYAPSLYGISLKMVHSPEAAQDVLQEAFINVWRHIDTYNATQERLFTWLLNIVRNTAINYCRVRQLPEGSQDDHPMAAPGQMTTSFQSHSPANHPGREALPTILSQEQQLMLEYCYLKGYTQARAAEALHLPLGTLRTRLREVIGRLREFPGEAAR